MSYMHPIQKKDYFIIITGISIILTLALGFGLVSGNILLIGIIMFSAILVTVVSYRQIGEVMTDALSDEISGRAARTSIGLTIIITSFIFAATFTFYFSGGWGTGMGVHDNGTMVISFSQYYPHGHEIFSDRVEIADPTNISGDELFSLEQMFLQGARVRDGPFYFGVACGAVTILLAGFYTILTLFYGREFEV